MLLSPVKDSARGGSPVAADTSDWDLTTYRLPTWVSPMSYRIHIVPDAALGVFRGTANILCRVDKEAILADPLLSDRTDLTLHALSLQIERVAVKWWPVAPPEEREAALVDKEGSGGASVPPTVNVGARDVDDFVAVDVSPLVIHENSETVTLTLPLSYRNMALTSSVRTHPMMPDSNGVAPAAQDSPLAAAAASATNGPTKRRDSSEAPATSQSSDLAETAAPDGAAGVLIASQDTGIAEGSTLSASQTVAGSPDEVDRSQSTPQERPLTSVFELVVEYIGTIHNQDSSSAFGLFRCHPDDPFFLSTHLEPTNARRLFPCFDEPNFKAYFQFVVDFDASCQVVSNTLPESEELVANTLGVSTSPTATGAKTLLLDGPMTLPPVLVGGAAVPPPTSTGSNTHAVSPAAVVPASPKMPSIRRISAADVAAASPSSGTSPKRVESDLTGKTAATTSTTTTTTTVASASAGHPPQPLGDLLGHSQLAKPTAALHDGDACGDPLLPGTSVTSSMEESHSHGSNEQPPQSSAIRLPLQQLDGPPPLRRTTFRQTPLLPTYVVGFVTGRFHTLVQSTKRRGIPCRVLFPVTDSLPEGWYALDLLTKAVDFYEHFFQYDLPLEKLDIVGLSLFGVLGMENWGMMTFLKEYLLVSETTPVERRQRIARLIGHEVAHQWFGNLVSVSWWQHLWLKEGFCRYLEFFFVQHVFPQWNMWAEFMTLILDDAMKEDCKPDKSHPVESCSPEPRRIFDSFDVISYGKGASLLRMLAACIGEDRLEAALRLLVRRFAFGNFAKADFQRCVFDAVEGDAVKLEYARVILEWVTQVGHPLLLVRRGFSEDVSSPSATPSSNDERACAAAVLSGIGGGGRTTPQPSTHTSADADSATHCADVSVGSATGGDVRHTTVTQFYMPDLTNGVLPYYVKQRQLMRTPRTSQVLPSYPSGTQPPPKQFLWSLSDVLNTSSFRIPLILLDLAQGQSSVRRTVLLTGSDTSVDHTSQDALTYFNCGGVGVLRCDYDVATWLRVFEYSPFLSASDRLAITMTLFRLRTLHIGKLFIDEPADRCTLLLDWLILTSQQRTLIHSTLWRYITEQVEVLLYLVRDHPCWGIFSQFVAAMYQHPMQLGLVSFHTSEKPVEFQAQGCLSRHTVMHILQNLAVCKSDVLLHEAASVVDWSVQSIILEDSLEASQHVSGGERIATGGGSASAPSSSSTTGGNTTTTSVPMSHSHGGSAAGTPTNHNTVNPGSGPFVSMPSNKTPTLSTDSTPSSSPQIATAMPSIPPQSSGQAGASNAFLQAPPTTLVLKEFDVKLESDITKATVAMQMVVESGDVARWWRLASILAACLHMDLSGLIPQSFLAKHNLAPLTVSNDALDDGAGVRSRWINILCPAVFALEDPAVFELCIAAIRCFAAISSPVAKVLLRNTKLLTTILERRPCPLKDPVRNGLIAFAAAYCSNSNIVGLFRCSLLGIDATEVGVSPHADTPPHSARSTSSDPGSSSSSRMITTPRDFSNNIATTKWPSTVSQSLIRHMQRMEYNCAWMDYVCDHYASFLKTKRKEGAWVPSGTPQTFLDDNAADSAETKPFTGVSI